MGEGAGESARPPGRLRLGTQGWNYAAWVGPLYPPGTRAADYLSVYARAFDTVEVDSTFYATPAESAVKGWVARTPPGFVLSLKLPRSITHELRLRDAHDELEEFVARARELGPRLGPILVQLGPDFSPAERPALEAFLPLLPADLRFAVEFRQPGWASEATVELLRTHGVGFALSDGRWLPRAVTLSLVERPTADFVYVRWMGANRDITDYSRVQIDRTPEIELWAEALRDLPERGFDVYGYVNNHFAGHSPATVRELQRRLGLPPVDPGGLADQISLF
jgi:uncharacterized protein YecE (DUF72 family)